MKRAIGSGRVTEMLERAVEQRVFHSGCLLAAVEGQLVLHQACGRARVESVFDLASLTKPLATAAVIMRLVAAGKLTLGTRLGRLLPLVAREPLGGVSVKQLLAHCAGLPAWRPYFERVAGKSPAAAKRAIRRMVAAEPLGYRPGSEAVYSDLGPILLDWALERRCGQPLDALLRRWIAEPLGLTRTGFLRLGADRPHGWHLVPTERCPRRGRLLGEVHDDNCHAMGGVSGHAGLFSSAYDVHRLVTELVLAHAGRRSLFDTAVVRRFFGTRPVAGATRVIGWDTPAGRGSSAGHRFSSTTVGHLGFTGTSLWIDLERPLWVVLLTNRVYHGREPNRLRRLRPRLHDAVVGALTRRFGAG